LASSTISARARAEMVELANGGVYVRAPGDYEPTEAEKDQARKSDEAEAKAKTRPASGFKAIKAGE
jgi:hypothetical protein